MRILPLVLLFLFTSLASGAPEVQYLSDLQSRFAYVEQGWGVLGLDTCAHQTDGKPLPLQVGSTPYAHGLGTHANGEIVVALAGEYDHFDATVGLQPLTTGQGSVVFHVYVDDQLQFDSGVVRPDTPPKRVSVQVAGAQEIRLVVTDAGDGINCDCANWADARLTRTPGATTQRLDLKLPSFDIAPFATLVTSDPARTDGARSGRIQEYRDEDLYLEWPLDLPADGMLPAGPDGRCTVGLNWTSRRPIGQLGVIFKSDAPVPPAAKVVIQGWDAATAWQGEWKPLKGTLERTDHAWRFTPEPNQVPYTGLRKIRWIFPKTQAPLRVERLTALTHTRTQTTTLLVQTEPTTGPVRVGIDNGVLNNAPATLAPGSITKISVTHTRPSTRHRTERTVLRFTFPDNTGCGVAVDDVLATSPVYVRDLGLYITPDPAPVSLADYKKQIACKHTVLEDVRRRPDQTLAAALARIHRPEQDVQPMMLSLACDNSKFIAFRDGTIESRPAFLNTDTNLAADRGKHAARLSVRFGAGQSPTSARKLDGDWLPAPTLEVRDAGIRYTQRALVLPAGDETQRPVCVVDFTAASDKPSEATVTLTFTADAAATAAGQPATLRSTDQGILVEHNHHLLALIEPGANLRATPTGNTVVLSAPTPAQFRVLLPGYAATAQDFASLPADPMSTLRGYWEGLLAPAAHLDLPDPFLMNVIRASQVHCMLAARNEADGARVAPWIGSVDYGPLESEAHAVVRGMDLLGHADFARRSLDYFISKYNPDGMLTTGYTLMGQGQHLQTLGEHYARYHDTEWLSKRAEPITRATDWIARQRAKTLTGPSTISSTLEYGLCPPGVMADWGNFAYYFCLNGYYSAGLQGAATALSSLHIATAPGPAWIKDAEAYQQRILTVYSHTQAQSPAVPLRNGTYVPFSPSQAHCPGPTADFFPGEDGNRSWCYDNELGAHHLIPQGVLDPRSRQADWIVDFLEDGPFLSSGQGEYPASLNQSDPFAYGGFAKLQPYYCKIAEIHAMRDDVKPFIRSYFNTLPSLLNFETLSFQEHFHGIGAWNKTHETGHFLQQTRFLLAMEHGPDALTLAPFVPTQWLTDGQHLSVDNLPTAFGPVSYRVTSHASEGYLEAMVTPPTRNAPRELLLRLRFPDGRPLARVTVNDSPHADFTPQSGTIRLPVSKGPLTIRAYR